MDLTTKLLNSLTQIIKVYFTITINNNVKYIIVNSYFPFNKQSNALLTIHEVILQVCKHQLQLYTKQLLTIYTFQWL